MNKKSINFLINIGICFGFLYFLCAFMAWRLNPGHWSLFLRILYAILALFLFVVLEEDDDTKSSIRVGKDSITKTLSDMFEEKRKS